MAKFLSGREPYFRVGIESTTEDLTSFSVVGNSYFTGILTASVFSGDGSQLTGIIATGQGIVVTNNNNNVGVTSILNFGQGIDVSSVSAGIVTITTVYSPVAGIASYSDVAGIATYAISSGVATYSEYSGFSTYSALSGIATYAESSGIATYSAFSGIATYAANSGIATYSSIAGIASYSELSGIATYATNSGVATYATNSGISTYSVLAGIATYAEVSGVSTVSGYADFSNYSNSSGISSYSELSGISTNVIGGIASVTRLNVSGITTLGVVTATQILAGIITATNFIGVGSGLTGVIGVSTQWITTSAGIHTLSNVGIGTTRPLYNLHVNGEVVVSGGTSTTQHIKIKAYEQDGGALSFEGSSGQLLSVSNNLTGTIFGINNIVGVPIIEANSNGTISLAESGGNVGVGTTLPTSRLFVVGDGFYTGVVTATRFIGDGSQITGISAGIATYAAVAGIATYASSAGIATYASSSGIATYADVAGITTYALTAGIATYASISGIATYAQVAGIATYSETSGISTYASSAGIATYADVAGIATYAQVSGIATYASSAGIATYAESSGIATYSSLSGISTNVIGGIANLTNLNVTGISTLGDVIVNELVSTGIVTAFKFVGDGSLLTNVIPSSSSGISISNNDENVGVALTINFGRYLSVSPASAGIVTVTAPSSIPTGISKNSSSYIATEGQTIFLSEYVVGSIDVFLNGSHLTEDEYTADNGTSIVLNESASEDDLLEIVSSQILFIPFGDYGDFSPVITDPFGIPISPAFDALTDPPATVAINDLGTLS
jgi:hypothetical protein